MTPLQSARTACSTGAQGKDRFHLPTHCSPATFSHLQLQLPRLDARPRVAQVVGKRHQRLRLHLQQRLRGDAAAAAYKPPTRQ